MSPQLQKTGAKAHEHGRNPVKAKGLMLLLKAFQELVTPLWDPFPFK